MVRLLYGGRVSLEVGIGSAVVCVGVALVLALLAGYAGGMTDAAISRSLDLIWSFPVYLLAVALATSLAVGGLRLGPLHVAATLAAAADRRDRGRLHPLRGAPDPRPGARRCGGWSSSTRRSRTGAGPVRIMVRELLPNVASIALVLMTLIVANNILTEAALSFLGVGVPVLTPSWGNIIQQGYSSIVTAPALTVAPGIAIMLTVVSLNVLGDALRDALDPHARIRIRG